MVKGEGFFLKSTDVRAYVRARESGRVQTENAQ